MPGRDATAGLRSLFCVPTNSCRPAVVSACVLALFREPPLLPCALVPIRSWN
jgi:hypothetical protein